MSEYRLFGAEMSPYSVKVRAYLRYKKIPHQWVVRTMDKMPEFSKYAKLPLVPCLACPDGTGLQDSTPIIEKMEALFPQPPVRVADPALDFIAALIEEYSDEWCNKHMFHYRWFNEVDADSAALRIAQEVVPEGSPASAAEQMAPVLKQRMVPRLSFVGSGRDNRVNAALIERSFQRHAGIVEAMLAGRSYLFGERPTMADFGVAAQLKELLSDPTPGAWLRANTPNIVAWIARMENPETLGELATLSELTAGSSSSLNRLLREEIAACFLPWSDANAKAIAAAAPSFTVHIDGVDFTQEPQKYHAKSLAEIRRKYAQVSSDAALRKLLEDSGCLRWLEA